MIVRGLLYHLASGQAFFAGLACFILAAVLSAPSSRRWVRTARTILACFGGILIVASATPLSPWLYALLFIAGLSWGGSEAIPSRVPARLAVGLRVAVIVVGMGAMLVELPYHRMPGVPHLGRPTLGIVADSMTAGLGAEGERTWPGRFADGHAAIVRDHSRAGATVATALRQAEAIAPDEDLVLLEIGGNDLLGGTSPDEYERGLASLLSAVRKPGRVVVLLELPLLPTFNAFGRIQRRLAREHGAILIPKRVLLGVLLRPGATLDSIHLAESGHRAMAVAVWDALRGAYD